MKSYKMPVIDVKVYFLKILYLNIIKGNLVIIVHSQTTHQRIDRIEQDVFHYPCLSFRVFECSNEYEYSSVAVPFPRRLSRSTKKPRILPSITEAQNCGFFISKCRGLLLSFLSLFVLLRRREQLRNDAKLRGKTCRTKGKA